MSTMTHQERGRLGYLAWLANNGIEATRERAAGAVRSYRQSFNQGHQCGVCPRTVLPDDVTPEDRATRAEALWKMHFLRLSAVRRAKQADRKRAQQRRRTA